MLFRSRDSQIRIEIVNIEQKTNLRDDRSWFVKVEVDTEKKVGHVIYKAGVVNLAVIEGAIAALGYDANETKADPDAYAELPGCCQKGGMH